MTATLKEYLTRTQVQQHTKIREMARRLSRSDQPEKYASRRRASLEDARGRLLLRAALQRRIDFGDPTGAAFVDLSLPLLAASGLLSRLDPGARRVVVRLAWPQSNLADAAAVAGTHGTGQLRFNGRKNELPAIDALEHDVIDPSTEQSTTAVLDKISGAVFDRCPPASGPNSVADWHARATAGGQQTRARHRRRSDEHAARHLARRSNGRERGVSWPAPATPCERGVSRRRRRGVPAMQLNLMPTIQQAISGSADATSRSSSASATGCLCRSRRLSSAGTASG